MLKALLLQIAFKYGYLLELARKNSKTGGNWRIEIQSRAAMQDALALLRTAGRFRSREADIHWPQVGQWIAAGRRKGGQ